MKIYPLSIDHRLFGIDDHNIFYFTKAGLIKFKDKIIFKSLEGVDRSWNTLFAPKQDQSCRCRKSSA